MRHLRQPNFTYRLRSGTASAIVRENQFLKDEVRKLNVQVDALTLVLLAAKELPPTVQLSRAIAFAERKITLDTQWTLDFKKAVAFFARRLPTFGGKVEHIARAFGLTVNQVHTISSTAPKRKSKKRPAKIECETQTVPVPVPGPTYPDPPPKVGGRPKSVTAPEPRPDPILQVERFQVTDD